MINLLQLIPVYIHLIKNLKIFIFKMLYLKYCYFFTKVKSINILDFIIFIFNLFHNFLQVIGTLKTLIELWLPFSLYIYAAEILRFSSYYHITRNIEYQTFLNIEDSTYSLLLLEIKIVLFFIIFYLHHFCLTRIYWKSWDKFEYHFG